MISKKILLPVLVGSAFYLGACGSDSPSSPAQNPVPASSAAIIPPASSSSILPISSPASSSSIALPASSAEAPPASSATTPSVYPALAPSANPAFGVNTYISWQSFHFQTEEQDMVNYPTLAPEFAEVFTAAYVPTGRVVWANQTGYYRNSCSVDDAAVPSMKYRGCTVSEGIGYGMLLAYFNGDIDSFNRMWNYTRAFRAYNNLKLMPWITKSFTWDRVDNSSATDADLDIATSLILMYYKTGVAAYLQDALTFVNAIWDLEVNPATLLIYSGDDDRWKIANAAYNLSYFSPVAIRLFATVDPSHNWMGVLDAMYAYMQLVQSMGTGVFPDWSDATGNAINPDNGSADKTYWTFNKESVRIPWRIAWDYYWYQDARALSVLSKLNQFIVTKTNGNPEDAALKINYSWNLSIGADYSNNAIPPQWYAAWCATGIAGNATWLEACTVGLNTKQLTNSSNSYFTDILMALYSGLLNGLYVRPF